MISNGRFQDAGATPGEAAAWVLRSICQAERIAAFGPSPATPSETFERWSSWSASFAQGTVALLVFSGNVAVERFEWPIAALWLDLSGGIVAGAMKDSFVWTSEAFASTWTDVASLDAAFAGSARETFAWRGEEIGIAFADSALARALFQAAPSEKFEAAWSANPTLR